MRFGLIHRIMTDALAALGLIALVSSGELHPVMTWVVLVGLVVAVLVSERFEDHGVVRHLATAGPLVLVAVQVVRFVLGGQFLPLAVEFAAALQVVRLATRRGAAHDQQVIVLALLHLIAGTVLGGGLAYGLCFLGFLVIAPGALVLSHLRREVEGNYRQGARDRTGLPVDVPRILRSRRVIGRPFLAFTCLMSVPIFVFTALLFVAFPRVGLSLLLLNRPRPERMVGFSDRVDLGGVGKLRTDPTLALRVYYPDLPRDPPPRLALYLRGTAFDQYDGRSWSRTGKHRQAAVQHGSDVYLYRNAELRPERSMRIELEPIDPPVLFLPPKAVALRVLSPTNALGPVPSTLFQGPENQLEYDSPTERGLRYQVFVARDDAQPYEPLSPAERDRYLRLPPNLTDRTVELARTFTRGRTGPIAQAHALELELRKRYRYDLESPSGAAENPLDHFLFESRRGHCEFYSTAMAMMLRTLGIPSRNVTGFAGGTFNRFGRYYAVRQGDAHSWVEAYLPSLGWVKFDPTPPADSVPRSEMTGVLASLRDFLEATSQRWNHHVVGYDLKQQVSLLQGARSKYGELQKLPGLKYVIDSPRRLLGTLVGLGLIIYGVYWLTRYRRMGGDAKPESRALEPARERMLELYAGLEAVLSVYGISRLPSTPPFAHARALAEMGHPIGEEVLALTRIYLEVRFGHRPFPVEEQRDFQGRVRALKAQPRPVKQAA